MRQPSPIADYLDTLARKLTFDPALSSRVRKEVEDHLWQAMAHEPEGASSEAQRRAIDRFGDPDELARQYAASSLLAQTKHVALVLILATVGVFGVMKGRVAWYEFVEWQLSDESRSVSIIGLKVIRYAFLSAIGLAIIALGYGGYRLSTTGLLSQQLRRFNALCALAAAALASSIIVEIALVCLRVSEARSAIWALIPVFSVSVEIILASLVARHIGIAMRRTQLAAPLLRQRAMAAPPAGLP